MRIAVVLGFLLLVGSASGGSDVSRHQVERGSPLQNTGPIRLCWTFAVPPWMRVHPETVYSIRLGDYLPGYAPTEAQRIAELRKRHPSIGLLAWHRAKNPPDYSNNLSALTVAQKVFPEINFIGLSRAGLEMLLGPPDAKPLSPQNSVTYTFGNGEQAVICRFHFDSKGNVESIEKLPSGSR